MKRLFLLLMALFFVGNAVQAENQPPIIEIFGIPPSFPDPEIMIFIVFLYDEDDDAIDGNLTYGLYLYPDGMLGSVQDIETFGILIADERDITLSIGSGQFSEGEAPNLAVVYSWGKQKKELMQEGFASLDKVLAGKYYVYLVANDGTNDPVFTVAGPIDIIRSAPTAIALKSWGAVKTER
ncbi:MAG: hypothetical protein HOC74_21600 [Gemmatimonadetes bacterium]|jgi:hypothetical protein|nr:hypothetical protein [Gemmatimonadota bacterium]